MMFKFVLLLVAIAAVSATHEFPPAPADGKCTPGQVYALDCNTCICGSNGILQACTLKGCMTGLTRTLSSPPSHADLPDFPLEGNCTPGVVYKLDCNTCVCGENGQGACTLMGCMPK